MLVVVRNRRTAASRIVAARCLVPDSCCMKVYLPIEIRLKQSA
jgi:hypothetical protein